MKLKVFLVVVLFSYLQVKGQQPVSNPCADEISPLKGFTLKQFEAYRDGKSLNLDRVAELNHYPNPEQVLKYSQELKLSASQKTQIKALDDYLQRKVLQMGGIILAQEKKLDDLFRAGKVNDGNLIYQTQQYGLYQGELRNAYLQAHLKTKNLLTPVQINKYDQLCGYTN